MRFADLGVREEIVRALAEQGIENAFAIQELTLPLALAGDDLIGQARTGMGAEDFAWFVTPESGVKGVYFSVGGTPAEDVATAPGHHSPLFRIDPRPSVTTGVEAMVVAAQALMPKG